MGIRGLNTYLIENVDVEPEVINNDDGDHMLLVDGNGWIFDFLDKIENCTHRELGGFYVEFDNEVKLEVYRLRDQLGFKLAVYFDGPSSELKADTRARRQATINDDWTNLCNQLHDKQHCKQSSLPIPSLLSEQLVSTLISCGVEVVRCSAEADQEIAISCRSLNSSAEIFDNRCFVYGNDR